MVQCLISHSVIGLQVQATFSTCEQEIIYLQAKLKEEVTARHALEGVF